MPTHLMHKLHADIRVELCGATTILSDTTRLQDLSVPIFCSYSVM